MEALGLMDAKNEEIVQEEITQEVDEESAGDVHDDGETAQEEPAKRDVVSELNAQIAELQGKVLRAQADFDNFRKRMRLEKEELASFANAKLIADLLPILDNFALAVQAGAQTATENDSLRKGVEMVYKQFLSVLESTGVRTMDAVGQPFDPARHEAVITEAVEGMEPGLVVEVLRSGFMLKEKVLRTAMVKISQ